eukprot:scaffold147714_cov15-Tisochrysis_lutea.AAC.1
MFCSAIKLSKLMLPGSMQHIGQGKDNYYHKFLKKNSKGIFSHWAAGCLLWSGTPASWPLFTVVHRAAAPARPL